MPLIQELGASQCRYPTTALPPHEFCGAATDGRAYCPEHDKLCHDHKKPKDWRALAGMIDAVETTVAHHKPRPEPKHESLDEALRLAENFFDAEGGLMRRT